MYYCSLSDVMFKRTLMHTIAIAAYTPCFVATALVKMSDGGKKINRFAHVYVLSQETSQFVLQFVANP